MRKKFTTLCVLLPALCFLIFPAAAQLQPSPFPEKAPVFLQLNKNYFLEGDTLGFSLQGFSEEHAWFLLEIYEETKVKKVAALTGQLKNGISSGRLSLPEEMQEGIYWARFLLDGSSQELLLPFYVFTQPGEIEPEAHYPSRLKLSLPGKSLIPSTENPVSYELWPPVLRPGGRIILKDGEGDILADTLLNKSGKGVILFKPEMGAAYQAEVWLQEARIAGAALPEVGPVLLEWKVSEDSLTIRYASEDSLQAYGLWIKGPEGFSHQEPAASKKELHMNHSSWPLGEYTLSLQSKAGPAAEEVFFLGKRNPALWLPDKRLNPGKQYLLSGRVEGVSEPHQAKWQLRVLSAHQESRLIKPARLKAKKISSVAEDKNPAPFFLRKLQQESSLDPSQLHGVVKSADGLPAKEAVISLLGRGLDRPYYALSDEEGRFFFNRLPLSEDKRYLLAFPAQGNSLLSTSVQGPSAPESFPAVAVDTFYLKKAKAYTEKHFFLQLLADQKEKVPQDSAISLPSSLSLSVPQEWISTFKTDDYIDFQNMSEFMKEAVPGLRVRYEEGRSYLRVLNIVHSQKKMYYKGEPLYMLNGYPLLNADSLLSVASDLVDSIQLVRKNASFYYGRIAQFGVVAMYTKQSQSSPLLPREGSWLRPVPVSEGLALEQLSRSSKKKSLPRLNGLLKWENELQLQADGSFSFELNTSDETGQFIVEVTGVSPDGQVIRVQRMLSVAPSGSL